MKSIFKKSTIEFLVVAFLLSLSIVFAQPPPPGPVPPNSAVITATVLKYSIWHPDSVEHKRLPILPKNQTFYSLNLEIITSKQESPELGSNLAVPGKVYETFSSDVLASDLVGKKITAKIKLIGDTNGVRWIISDANLISDEKQKVTYTTQTIPRANLLYISLIGVLIIFALLVVYYQIKKHKE